VNGGCPGGGLVKQPLGLRLRLGQGGFGLLAALGRELVRRGLRGAAYLLGLGARRGDRSLRLILGGVQHPLRLLPRVGADPIGLPLSLGPEPLRFPLGVGADLVRFALGVGAEAGDLFLGLAPLGLRLILGELEDLADSLADLLVRRTAGQRLLAGGGHVPAEKLGVVQRAGQTLLQILYLVVGTRDVLVHLAAAVAAHLHLELFVLKIRQEVIVFVHGSRIFGPSLRGDIRSLAAI
jgi:hypothetical protein